MTRGALLVPLIAIALAAAETAARAQGHMTLLSGVYSGAPSRPAIGYAWGFGDAGGGGEVEVAATRGSGSVSAGSITAAWFFPTPLKVRGASLYGLAGLGAYADRHTEELTEAIALGIGTKIRFAGPIKIRLEYRLYVVRKDGVPPPQRLSAGLSVGF